MFDAFDLPVEYKNETLMLPAQLVQSGYTHAFKVEVNGQEVLFEPDEEGSYRAVVKPEEMNESLKVDLLRAVAVAIEAVVR